MTAEAIADQVRARIQALRAQKAEAEQQAAEVRQTLALLQRNIDGMAGGIQELEGMLAGVGTANGKEEAPIAVQSGPDEHGETHA